MLVDSKTILLVDDHLSVLSIYTRVLQQEGFTVLKARDAQEALETSQNYLGPIDLLVADLFLPSRHSQRKGIFQRPPRNGLEMAQCIRNTRPHTEVLFISGHEDKEIQSLGGLPPGAVFLRKPFATHTFLDAVRQVLRLPVEGTGQR